MTYNVLALSVPQTTAFNPVMGEMSVFSSFSLSRSRDIVTDFVRLSSEWRKDTRVESRASVIAEHPSYRRIIAMGDDAVPLILRDLSRKPDHWFIALHEITGVDPVSAGDKGRMKRMAQAWIDWGIENDLI